MISKLIFDLNDEDDKAIHAMAVQAPRLHAALNEFRELLRKKRKYENDEHAAKIESEFYEIMAQYDITLE